MSLRYEKNALNWSFVTTYGRRKKSLKSLKNAIKIGITTKNKNENEKKKFWNLNRFVSDKIVFNSVFFVRVFFSAAFYLV